MIDYRVLFEGLLDTHRRSPAAFDKASVTYVQELIIKFEKQLTTDRDTRLKIIGAMVGRPVSSTKNLKVAEVAVLMKMLDNSQFLDAMRLQYDIPVKESL